MSTNKPLLTLLIPILTLLPACKSRQATVLPERQTILERTIHTQRIDTVYIDVEPELRQRETRDTLSRLSTRWAESEASIDSAGILRHWLRNREGRHAVQVVTRIDTILIESNSEKTIQVPVASAAGSLTWWQRARLTSWWYLVAIIGAAAIALISRLIPKKPF